MWLLLFSLAGLVVIFGWVVFVRPDFIAPNPIDEEAISQSLISRMYPKIKQSVNFSEDCYYAQMLVNNRLRTFKSERASVPKNVYVEDIVLSVSERPYGIIFITKNSGLLVTQNFAAFRTACDFSDNGR